ncbi:uncharacterized protein FIBRA_08092 [Fibroporia radiculosa]|uniref:Uncharacterized protein n=1 Tax=Fibroporia radiculosa TaxID=599839 RepID=J4IC62_9APHY|nr:uncharacterized protein FIBRA_08092 [Fibroporia radiculosa]CCM05856.1 predicted protein [Fibroporia radiculosa]
MEVEPILRQVCSLARHKTHANAETTFQEDADIPTPSSAVVPATPSAGLGISEPTHEVARGQPYELHNSATRIVRPAHLAAFRRSSHGTDLGFEDLSQEWARCQAERLCYCPVRFVGGFAR